MFKSLIFGKHRKFAISFDLRGVLNFRRLYYTQDSIAITFHNDTEITMFRIWTSDTSINSPRQGEYICKAEEVDLSKRQGLVATELYLVHLGAILDLFA